MNHWSKVRNKKLRDRIKEMRDQGEKPSVIYELLSGEFKLSPSRIKQIEFGIKS